MSKIKSFLKRSTHKSKKIIGKLGRLIYRTARACRRVRQLPVWRGR